METFKITTTSEPTIPQKVYGLDKSQFSADMLKKNIFYKLLRQRKIKKKNYFIATTKVGLNFSPSEGLFFSNTKQGSNTKKKFFEYDKFRIYDNIQRATKQRGPESIF